MVNLFVAAIALFLKKKVQELPQKGFLVNLMNPVFKYLFKSLNVYDFLILRCYIREDYI